MNLLMSVFLLDLHSGNFIAGFNFNPAVEIVATIDSYGVYLISDVTTSNYSFHTVFGVELRGR